MLADAAIHHDGSLWTLSGNYLIAFVLFAAPAVLRRSGRTPSVHRDLLRLAMPTGAAGFLLVVLASNASIHWGSAVVGLAPLAMAVVVCWAGEIGSAIGPRARAGAAGLLVFALLAVLFGSSYKDGAPLTLRYTVTAGTYAGITTNAGHAGQLAEFDRLAKRWVTPTTTVAAVELPGAFLLPGGVPYTDAVYLNTGAAGAFTAAYYDARGRWPDVIWVPLYRVDQAAAISAADPFLSRVFADYRLVERSPATATAVYVLETSATLPVPAQP
jgi:hypothetical protein